MGLGREDWFTVAELPMTTCLSESSGAMRARTTLESSRQASTHYSAPMVVSSFVAEAMARIPEKSWDSF